MFFNIYPEATMHSNEELNTYYINDSVYYVRDVLLLMLRLNEQVCTYVNIHDLFQILHLKLNLTRTFMMNHHMEI